MKGLGYALITAGFLIAAYFAVRSPHGVPATPFLTGLGIGILGVVLVRLALRQEATHEERLATNIETLETSLVSLVDKVESLERDKDEIDVYELRHVIDDRFPADLDAFVQARESIAHSFSLQAYADVMSPFAAGERHLNRVWSASTDGYIDEAHTYISLARQEFEHALEVFRGMKTEAARTPI
jgi:hypothetical protein